MKSPRVLSRLVLAALVALPLAACDKSLGTIDFSGPFDIQWSTLRVSVENSSASEINISYGGTTIPVAVGQRQQVASYLSLTPLPESGAFDVRRNSMLVHVAFKPLHYPEKKGDVKDTTIVIREPSPGQFTATAAEPDWIRIVAVTQP